VTTAALAVLAGGALAATTTIIGTSGNDVITKTDNGNYIVYGLAGADTLTFTGKGNDVIDGDGSCMKGSDSSEYCEHKQIKGDGGDTITAGSGDDTIYGGGGKNKITVGSGDDTIYGGPIGDTITVGTGNDEIYLGLGGVGSGYTGSVVTIPAGQEDDFVHAQNGVKDVITCNKTQTTVWADKVDVTTGCAHVIYTADPNPGPNPRLAGRTTKHRKSTHKPTHKRHVTKKHQKTIKHARH
jgi:Ca2+-binding RTX toxin-like protein